MRTSIALVVATLLGVLVFVSVMVSQGPVVRVGHDVPVAFAITATREATRTPTETLTETPTLPATPVPTPEAPKTLQAIVVQDQLLIQLLWEDNADNESTYIVERSTSGAEGPWTMLVSLPADTILYFDRGLTNGATYWYRVAASNNAGMSGYSNTVFGTATELPTPPVGDADCDGSVTSIDAALVLQFNAGLFAFLACEAFADANADGVLTSIDALLILELVAGLLDALPP